MSHTHKRGINGGTEQKRKGEREGEIVDMDDSVVTRVEVGEGTEGIHGDGKNKTKCKNKRRAQKQPCVLPNSSRDQMSMKVTFITEGGAKVHCWARSRHGLLT